jgi:TonB family protein
MKPLLVAALCFAALAARVCDANESPTAAAGSNRTAHFALPLSEDEDLAPAARGVLLTEAQLRYCLAQPVRIDAVRPLLNHYAPAEVQNFNTLVADFNARCGNYRFKPEDQTEAKQWVEQNRAQIEQAARESYATQFPAEARTPRTKTTAAPATPAATPAPAASAPAPAAAAPAPVTSRDGEIAVTARVAEDPKPVTTPKPATTSERPAVRQAQAPKHTAPETGRPASVPPRPLPGRALNETAKEPAQSKPAETATTAPIPAESIAPAPVEDNTISKPRTFPNETAAAPAAQPSTPSSPAPSPGKPAKSEAKPLAPSLAEETKPAKTAEKPVTSAPTPPASTQSAKAEMPETPAQPESKPTRPARGQKSTTGRKPEQVAAVTPKPEPVASGPEAALARLTKEIQRAGSQVLPQPANAGTSGDVTTQVEVHFAAGGFVRSIVVGESSGSPALDEQALAVARATRFPDVPDELRSRDFSVRFPVQFRAAR